MIQKYVIDKLINIIICVHLFRIIIFTSYANPKNCKVIFEIWLRLDLFTVLVKLSDNNTYIFIFFSILKNVFRECGGGAYAGNESVVQCIQNIIILPICIECNLLLIQKFINFLFFYFVIHFAFSHCWIVFFC